MKKKARTIKQIFIKKIQFFLIVWNRLFHIRILTTLCLFLLLSSKQKLVYFTAIF